MTTNKNGNSEPVDLPEQEAPFIDNKSIINDATQDNLLLFNNIGPLL